MRNLFIHHSKKLNKKGFTIAEIPSLAIAFVIIAIVLSLGATVLGANRATQCTGGAYWYNVSSDNCQINGTDATSVGGYAWNASTNGLTALDTFSSWQNTLALVAVVVVVLGVVMLLGRQMKG